MSRPRQGNRSIFSGPNRALTACVLTLATVVPPNNAWAAFTAVKPPTCASYATHDYRFSMGNPNPPGIGTHVILDPSCGGSCANYSNKLDYLRYIIGNRWTNEIQFKVEAFQTESGFDHLKIGPEGSSPTTYTGSLSVPFWSVLTPNAGSFSSNRGLLRFTSDVSITGAGVAITAARLCTTRTTEDTGTVFLSDIRENTGVLLGTDDVIYGYINYESGHHNSLALRPRFVTPGVDFDLYARCGALPTPTQYDWRGYSSDSQEWLDLGTACASTGTTLYVAIHSYQGSGEFVLVKGRHKSGAHRTIRAGTKVTESEAQMTAFQTGLRNGARMFYGATEGDQIIDTVYLYNSANCNSCGGLACDLCFNDTLRPNAPICGAGVVEIQSVAPLASIIAHEWGHKYYCLPDEYVDRCDAACTIPCGSPSCPPGGGCFSCSQCGHSLMGTPVMNMCVDHDHTADKHPNTPPSTAAHHMHEIARLAGASINWSTTTTYDLYDYTNFDFNDQVCNVVRL